MLKYPLIVLTATAILLPANVYAGDDRERKPRAQHKERVEKQRPQRSSKREERQRDTRQSSSQSRSSSKEQERAAQQAMERAAREAAFQTHPAARKARERQSSKAQEQQQQANRYSGKPRYVAPAPKQEVNRQTHLREITRDRVNASTREHFERTEARRTTRPQTTTRPTTRVTPRGEHTRTVINRDFTRMRYSDGHAERDRDRRYDNHNRYNDRRTSHWRDRGRDYYYYGSRNRHRHKHKRDIDIYFGFGPYYYGDFAFSIYSGYPYHGYYSSWDYFGDWPYRYGYYRAQTHWLWHHRHHHYHYGDYCPHAHSSVNYSSNYSYSQGYSDGSNVAGLLLGGIVGGIIGAEIDGGHNKTTGAVIGAAVGAAIGASATDNNATYRGSNATYVPPSNVTYQTPDGVEYDAYGRHVNESTLYTPPPAGSQQQQSAPTQAPVYEEPQEIRTCIRYENRDGTYMCTKWTLEIAGEQQ